MERDSVGFTTQSKIDAVAYVEWGGQYDRRELKLDDWHGKYWYEDETGGDYSFTTNEYDSPREAKQALLRDVFRIGEPETFVDFGEFGIIRACDPQADCPIIGERAYDFVGLEGKYNRHDH